MVVDGEPLVVGDGDNVADEMQNGSGMMRV
jgi:hypothetical protein